MASSCTSGTGLTSTCAWLLTGGRWTAMPLGCNVKRDMMNIKCGLITVLFLVHSNMSVIKTVQT